MTGFPIGLLPILHKGQRKVYRKMNTLVALWDESERKNPGKTALVAGEVRLTYEQMGERIRRLAAGLAFHGNILIGDTVAVLTPNCAEFVISYFAIVRLGAVIQPIDERLAPEEIKATLLDSQARLLIVHHRLWQKYEKIRDEIPSVKGVICIGDTQASAEQFEKWISHEVKFLGTTPARLDDVAELMYTSGTASVPKAVLRTHRNARSASRNSIRGFGYRSDDVIAITMPMSHSSSLSSQMLPMIEQGGTVVLLERFDAVRLLQVIQAEKVTCMRAVPAMLRSLLVSPNFRSQELPSLRLLLNSSAPIDPQTYQEIKRRFSRVEVMNSYGLTEASTCTVLPDTMAFVRPDSVGVPIDGVEMQVVDECGCTIQDGTEGEILVRGEHVFVGYRNRPEETRMVLVDGWLKTGDLGYRDAQGFYYLRGRKDDVINCGGHKVMPFEVESCILQLPEVVEVAVVGHAHRILGQVAKALVVARCPNGLNAKHIINHCARQLASYKVPFFVEFVPELPKNSVGKVLRRKVCETTGHG